MLPLKIAPTYRSDPKTKSNQTKRIKKKELNIKKI